VFINNYFIIYIYIIMENLNVITFDNSKPKKQATKKKEDDTPQFLNQNQQMILNNLLKPDQDRLNRKKDKYTNILLNQNN